MGRHGVRCVTRAEPTPGASVRWECRGHRSSDRAVRRLSQQSGTRGLAFFGRWLGGRAGGLGQFSAELLEFAPESLEITLSDVLVERPFEELVCAMEQRDDVVPLDVQEGLCDGAALDLVDHLLKLD